MIKIITFLSVLFLFSCATSKKGNDLKKLPPCLQTKMKTMSENPGEGTPQSITRYNYKGQTVYYMVSPCCDKYNIVFDSVCNILGFPDGGFTGKGDGRMTDFHNEAKDGKVVWKKDSKK
jgi:hypothetical protein